MMSHRKSMMQSFDETTMCLYTIIESMDTIKLMIIKVVVKGHKKVNTRAAGMAAPAHCTTLCIYIYIFL